ncbi:sulfite exporter TauE/SafE family protein [Aquabacterium sp.]|uniref:sulfite exporter TauE/SafE family protein n=1 Tax=Aquabacterium sp. TaxID=1872578 RepID=UPI002B5AB9CE|nr:sulfite exporter TauE/SafE family protein [Aquabacterium sp.]HSW03802.1 sulfite exporter TauE/SafE family protein [Aquabacterium sp.]
MPDPQFLFIASLAALLVGLSKGGLPSTGILAVPILSLLISPVKAAALLLPIYIVSDVVGIWLYRRDFSARNLKILIPGALVGIFIGWCLAAYLSDRMVGLMVGLLGVGFCLNVWFGPQPHLREVRPGSVPKGLFWGALSGFTSFVSHAGSPPYQIYVLPQGLSKAVFAGTSTILFAVINLAKLPPYMQLRPYSMADLSTAALLVPAALIGTVLGAWLTKRLADRWFFRLIQGTLFLISCKLIFEGLRSLLA